MFTVSLPSICVGVRHWFLPLLRSTEPRLTGSKISIKNTRKRNLHALPHLLCSTRETKTIQGLFLPPIKPFFSNSPCLHLYKLHCHKSNLIKFMLYCNNLARISLLLSCYYNGFNRKLLAPHTSVLLLIITKWKLE